MATTDLDRKIERLRGVELFKRCSDQDLHTLAGVMEERSIAPGTVLCEQGRVADELYIIIDGHADVDLNGRRVATVGPGESVGEMALLDHLPRSATVTATSPMQVYVITASGLQQVLPSSGVAMAMLELLSRRIRELDHGREGLSARY